MNEAERNFLLFAVGAVAFIAGYHLAAKKAATAKAADAAAAPMDATDWFMNQLGAWR